MYRPSKYSSEEAKLPILMTEGEGGKHTLPQWWQDGFKYIVAKSHSRSPPNTATN